MKPNSSRDDGEDEIGVRFGQIEKFLHARAETDAEPFAATDRDQRLRQLESVVERMFPRIEERGETLDAVVLRQSPPTRAHRHRGNREIKQIAHARAAEPHHADGHRR